MIEGLDTAAHVHIPTAGDPEIQPMVEFRDRLRTNEEHRDRYAAN